MKEEVLVINNPMGLHARPAAMLVKKAAQFKSDIRLSRGNIAVNAKSIMGLLMLAAGQGAEVTLAVKGEDEDLAFEELKQMLTGTFGEI